MEGLIGKLKGLYKQKGKQTVIASLGVLGILLIGLSSCSDGAKSGTEVKVTEEKSDDQYCIELETKISEIVGAITGDKECLVAVTLENGSEYVYADQSKTDTDQTEDTAGDGVTTKESIKSEQEYIIVEGEDGSQTALMVTEKKPSVRGVAIVTYGMNEQTKDQILGSVTAMLGISSRKVSITSKAVNN